MQSYSWVGVPGWHVGSIDIGGLWLDNGDDWGKGEALGQLCRDGPWLWVWRQGQEKGVH